MIPFSVTVASVKGDILVIFPEPYRFITLPPAGAREVAAALIAEAEKIERADQTTAEPPDGERENFKRNPQDLG